MPDAARNPNPPAAPAGGARPAIPPLKDELLERCLTTKRPVYRQVENMFPDFLRQCYNTIQEGLRQRYDEIYDEHEVLELLTRVCRLVRRAARNRGPDAAVEEMRNHVHMSMVIVTTSMTRDQDADMAMFEDSEDEDQFELMYAMSQMANAGGSNLGGGNIGGGNVGSAMRGGMGGRGGFGGMW